MRSSLFYCCDNTKHWWYVVFLQVARCWHRAARSTISYYLPTDRILVHCMRRNCVLGRENEGTWWVWEHCAISVLYNNPQRILRGPVRDMKRNVIIVLKPKIFGYFGTSWMLSGDGSLARNFDGTLTGLHFDTIWFTWILVVGRNAVAGLLCADIRPVTTRLEYWSLIVCRNAISYVWTLEGIWLDYVVSNVAYVCESEVKWNRKGSFDMRNSQSFESCNRFSRKCCIWCNIMWDTTSTKRIPNQDPSGRFFTARL